ncbi:MAG: IS110 family transposase [Solirubrobacterales bacterium]
MEWTVAIGVDTHKEMHVAVALDALGAQLDSEEIPTTPAGYRRLLSWAQELGVPAFAIEGTGSYGAGLARFLERAGVAVYECERPRRQERRRGKNDLVDAALAARRLVAGEGLSLPRGGGGRREDLRLLLLERRGAMQARNAALNQLSALVVTAPEHVRERLGGLSGERLAHATARLRPRPDVVTGVLRRLGKRAERLSKEVADAERALATLLAEVAPELLDECGVGPVCGAQLLVSSGDPSRMKSEASFAALAGTSPVDASSGKQRRHRLNRGGDRQLNWALHVIALQRVRHHDDTSDYYERLLAAGKTTREARRCVKRALARHFYRRLCEIPTLPLTT